MSFSTESQKKPIRWLLLPFLLLLASAFLPAQSVTYRGRVVDECSGDPLEGVEVRFWGNSPGQTPGAYYETTDANGEFVAPLFGFDTWLITVSDPTGVTSPGQYFLQASNGSQAGINFSLLPGDWEPILNGSSIPPSNNPSFPVPLCLNEANCLDLDEAFKEKYGGTGEPAYCFRGRLFETDRRGGKGKLLAESPCIQVGGRLQVGTEPCGTGVNLTEVFEQIDAPLDVPLLIEIIQFCCNDACQPDSKEALVNRQSFYIEIKPELGFDFVFGAGPEIEQANAGTPGNISLTDNEVPRTETLPGTLVGPLSLSFNLAPGLDASRVDGYQVIIEEVSCADGEVQLVLYDETVPEEDYPTGGFDPNLYLVGPPGEEELGYFLVNSGLGGPSLTDGKCYKVTIIADSDCGAVERFSYFNLAQPGEVPGCPFCLVDGRKGDASATAAPIARTAVFPVPTNGQLNVQLVLSEARSAVLELRNLSGQSLQRLEDEEAVKGLNTYQFDLSAYPSGIYLLHIADGKQTFIHKIVKQ